MNIYETTLGSPKILAVNVAVGNAFDSDGRFLMRIHGGAVMAINLRDGFLVALQPSDEVTPITRLSAENC